MNDLETLRAELQWCIANNGDRQRTGLALQWALELVDEIERERIRSLPNLQDQLVSEGMDSDAARDYVRHLIDVREKQT